MFQKLAIIITLLFSITGCNLSQKSVSKKSNDLPKIKINKDLIHSKSNQPMEQLFLTGNQIPEAAQDPLLNLYFSFLKMDDHLFIKQAKQFLQKNPRHPMTPWILYRTYRMIEQYRIPYHLGINIFALPQNTFARYLAQYYSEQLQQKIMITPPNTDLKTFSRWTLKGPYRFHQYQDIALLLQGKFPKIETLFQEKEIDFKSGSITIPEALSTTALYQFTQQFTIKKQQKITLFLTTQEPITCIIDGITIFEQPLNHHQQLKHRFKTVTLSPGKHTINLIVLKLGSGNITLKHTPIIESPEITTPGQITLHSDQNTSSYIQTIIDLSGYHPTIKLFWLSELLLDLFKNGDYAYTLLSHLPEKHFYRDFLLFRFYEKNSDVPRGIKNSKRQHYLKKSLEKNPNFLKAQIYQTLFYDLQQPYQGIKSLLPIITKSSFFPLYRALISLYQKTEQHQKARTYLEQLRNRPEQLLINFSSYLKNENRPLFQQSLKIIENSFSLLEGRKKYRIQDQKWMMNYIKTHPFDKRSLAMLYLLKQSNYKEISPLEEMMLKTFPITMGDEHLKKIKDIKQFLKETPMHLYRSARFFNNHFPKQFTHHKDLEAITDFEKNSTITSKTSKYPVTRVLDEDTVMITSRYNHIAVNRSIVKLNTKSGVNRYATLTRRKKYLKIATIDGKTHQFYRPEGNSQTSEISLNNLKIGDYIVTITYQLNHFPYRNNLYNWGNFFYRGINSDLYKGILDLYIADSVTPSLIPLNGFFTTPTIKNRWEKFTHYHYILPEHSGIKQEQFAPRSILFYTPSLQVVSGINWKKILHTFRTAFLYSVQKNNYLNIILKKEIDVKTEKDLKKLVTRFTTDYRHINAPYSKPITTYLSKQGNLVFLLHYILKQKNISSDILIYHTADNFISTKIPERSYYSYYILSVYFNGKQILIDPSNQDIAFNQVNPYTNGMAALRIDSKGNIFKEHQKGVDFPQSKSIFNLKLISPDQGEGVLTIELPGYLGVSIKNFIKKQSQQRLEMIFQQWLIKKMGYIDHFKFSIKHLKSDEKPLTLKFTFTLNQPTQKSGDQLIISNLFKKDWGDGFYNRGLFHNYTVLKERHTPVELRFYNHLNITTITPPKGYQVNATQVMDQDTPFGTYKQSFEQDGKNGVFTNTYTIKTGLVPVKQYPDLITLTNLIKQIRGVPVVLEKTAN